MEKLFKKRGVDYIIEVRDARLPFSSGNYFVTDNLPARIPRMIVLNKADLVDAEHSMVISGCLLMGSVTVEIAIGGGKSVDSCGGWSPIITTLHTGSKFMFETWRIHVHHKKLAAGSGAPGQQLA